MREFSLEEAKAGKPVCTRDGRNARIICFDAKFRGYPILALVEQEDGTENVNSFCLDGRYNSIEKGWENDSFLDLFMKPEKHEGWSWVSHNNLVSMFVQIYETEEEALSHKPGRSECFLAKVEWEE